MLSDRQIRVPGGVTRWCDGGAVPALGAEAAGRGHVGGVRLCGGGEPRVEGDRRRTGGGPGGVDEGEKPVGGGAERARGSGGRDGRHRTRPRGGRGNRPGSADRWRGARRPGPARNSRLRQTRGRARQPGGGVGPAGRCTEGYTRRRERRGVVVRAPAEVEAVEASSATSTPKSRARPASPSAYPWPSARSFQPAPRRYSSASSSTVSRCGRGGVNRASAWPPGPVTWSVGAGSPPSAVPGSAALTTTVTRVAPGRRAAGSTVRVSPCSRAPGAVGWL